MKRCTLLLAALLLALPAVPGRGDYLGKNAAQWQAEFTAARDARAKRNAAFALGKLGGEALEAVPALLKCLESDKEDAAVRETAVYSLGQIIPRGRAGDDVIKVLCKFATAKVDERIRRSAVVALGNCGPDTPDVRATLSVALDDANAGVRQNAVWALGEVCQHSDSLPLDSLKKGLRDGDKLVKRDAALALVQILTPHPRGDEQAEGQRVAKIRDKAKQALTDLVACAGHDYVELRKAACGALVHIVEPKPKDGPSPSQAAVKPLAKACGDDDFEVRRNAALALANIGGEDARPAVPVLVEILRKGDLDSKRLAALAFRSIGNEAPEAIPDLLRILTKDPDTKLRYNTAIGLGGFQTDANKVVPVLVDRVADKAEKTEIRVAAAMSLQSAGPCEEAVKGMDRLVAVLDDPKQPTRVRERVLWALRVHKKTLFNHDGAFAAVKNVLTEPGLGVGGAEGKMLRYDSAFLLSVLKPGDAPDDVFPVFNDFLQDKTIRIYTGLKVTRVVPVEGKGGSSDVHEDGTQDGRIMAVAALIELGNRVRAHQNVIDRVRQLRDTTDEKELRDKCDELLKKVGK
jgi:HEAT repeat protein